MDQITTLQQWTKGTRINTMAHFRAASYYIRNDRKLGLLSALTGAIVTSSLFISISEDTTGNLLWITGIISIVSTALTTAYSFLKQAELSEKHYRAATDYSHIRKKLELLQLKGTISNEDMEAINEEIHKLTEHAPSIPQKIFDLCQKNVESQPEKLKISSITNP